MSVMQIAGRPVYFGIAYVDKFENFDFPAFPEIKEKRFRSPNYN
jgi:hypothetical protein